MRAYAAHVKLRGTFAGVDGDGDACDDAELGVVSAVAFYDAAKAWSGTVGAEPTAVCLERTCSYKLAVGQEHLDAKKITVCSGISVLCVVVARCAGEVSQNRAAGADGSGGVAESALAKFGIKLDMADAGLDDDIAVLFVYLNDFVHS